MNSPVMWRFFTIGVTIELYCYIGAKVRSIWANAGKTVLYWNEIDFDFTLKVRFYSFDVPLLFSKFVYFSSIIYSLDNDELVNFSVWLNLNVRSSSILTLSKFCTARSGLYVYAWSIVLFFSLKAGLSEAIGIVPEVYCLSFRFCYYTTSFYFNWWTDGSVFDDWTLTF